MSETKIEYVDASWNPITGCAPDFDCWEYCWARKFAARHAKNPNVKHYERYKGFKPALWIERLSEPLRRKKPTRYAVNFMGDMFCKDVPYSWVDQVFAGMSHSPRHTFLLLTKRPDRMADYLRDVYRHRRPALVLNTDRDTLENVWLGTSISDQATADERIPHLMSCPGNLWLSIEPMRGPIDLTKTKLCSGWILDDPAQYIDWVVLGGGPFPIHPDWVRSVRKQCQAYGVPFWFKQWGAPETGCGLKGHPMFEAGYNAAEKKGGDVLDGKQYHELP